MDMRLMKKGFAFSFLAMFFAFLIFAFGSYYLFQSDLTINDEYKMARVQAIQSEIDYFQESYFQNVVSFSLYNVLEQIQQNKTLFDSIKGNHTKLNDLIYEGISRGTLGGENIGVLENKTLEYFVEIFNEDFLENHKGNFNYTLVGINIYERNPYFLSLDVAGFYNISIEDNLSSWEFIEFQTIGFPIADLTNPSYLGSAENQSIRFSEFYLPEEDLDEETFNETLKESYVKVYVQNDFKYSIGNSFLKRMLGISRSSYDEVLAFWSFDYDEEYGGVYDNSRHIEIGDFYSNAQLLLNFNDGNANDSSVNENDGIVSGATNISGCIFDNCYSFDGAGNNIEIEDDTSLNYNESFSISTWFRTLDVVDHQTIIAKSDGGLYMDAGYMLNTNTSGSVRFAVSDGTDSYGFDSVEEYDDGFWHHVVVVVDKEEQNVTLYIDGINSEYRLIGGGNFGATFPTGDYSNSENLTIGSESDGENFFNGDIDELSIYSKVVSKEDVAKLYRFKRILRLDYVDSEFGKSAYFDGKDDVLIISDSDDLSLGNEFSVGMWV
ncbi:MAG: LamG domain-containing protein, partial [Nanoarchaeota archaeon]